MFQIIDTRVTFYGTPELVRAMTPYKDRHELSGILRDLAAGYFLTKTPLDQKRRDLAGQEELMAQAQHKAAELRSEISLLERAVEETKDRHERERRFRQQVQHRVGDPKVDWREWCNEKRADVQEIGAPRAREIVEQMVGRRIW